MTTNMKIEAIRKIMDRKHERHRKDGEDLKRLCALLTELVQEFGPACGADGEVIALAIEPKEP